jgi:hypothetical protein
VPYQIIDAVMARAIQADVGKHIRCLPGLSCMTSRSIPVRSWRAW